MHEVVPGLHIADAMSASLSSEAGITHLLNVTPDLPFPGASGAEFVRWRLPVDDDISAPLHEHLEAGAAFIDAGINSGGTVCCLCADAKSASAAVCVFYLMRFRKLSLAAALETIFAALPSAQPNVGFFARFITASLL